MPKVSVIMGVYNCKNKKLLKKSIESIVNQSYKDWEFIICNDGSNDDTLDCLYNISKMDERIKIISYDINKGLNNALNTCLKLASGEYIARQDDDDYSDKERLKRETEFLDNNLDYAIVGTLANVCNDEGKWGEYIVEEEPTKNSFLWNSPFIHPSVMIRAEVYRAVNGYRISKETRRCEDYDMFMRMYALGFKGYNIQEKLYNYRFINHSNKKYRSMKYRVDEAIVRFKGYKELKILFPKGILYVIKPIIIGLIPQRIYYHIINKHY